MTVWSHTGEGLIRLLAGAFIASVWQGAVLAVSIGMCLRWMPGLASRYRWLLWLTTFLVAGLLSVATLLHAAFGHGMEKVAEIQIASSWALWLAAVWFALSLYRAVRLLHGAGSLLGILRRSQPMDAAFLPAWKSGTVPKICSSVEVDVPCVAGFCSPRILLPADLVKSTTNAELAQILLHEYEHLRRRDVWTNLMQKVGLTLFPLNPVLLWVDRCLCAERELACDDGVLRATNAPKAYATCLTRLAEVSLLRRGYSLALGAWHRQSELSRRVSRILEQPAKSMSPLRSAMAAGAVLMVLGCGTALLHRAPQFVGFRDDSGTSEKAAVLPGAVVPQVAVAQAKVGRWPIAQLTAFEVPLSKPARGTLPVRLSRRSRQAPSYARKISASSMQRISLSPIERPRRYAHAARMVPVAWQENGSMQPLIFSDYLSVTYAAVAVRDGWILIQL